MGKDPFLDKVKEYWLGISVIMPADWSMDYVNGYSNGLVWQFHDVGYLDPAARKVLPLILRHSESGWQIINHVQLNGQGRGNPISFSVIVPYRQGQ